MILDFLVELEGVYFFFQTLNYILKIFGVLLIAYAFFVFLLTNFCLFRTDNLTPLKAIHIISITEVYGFVCGVLGIILLLKVYNLLFLKLMLFLILVIFNAITITRLISKTAYFYELKVSKQKQSESGQ